MIETLKLLDPGCTKILGRCRSLKASRLSYFNGSAAMYLVLIFECMSSYFNESAALQDVGHPDSCTEGDAERADEEGGTI